MSQGRLGQVPPREERPHLLFGPITMNLQDQLVEIVI
jgi:hypothetical protein